MPPIPDVKATTFLDYFAKRQREILALTRALVETESPSGDEAGSKAVVSLLAAAARTINAVTTIDRIPVENYGENLRVHAFGNGRKGAKTILILGHTDTVHPLGSLQSRPWRVEGNRAYGPGVFDMKANCALALEAIRACASLNIVPQSQLVLLLTCDEETGSMSGRGLVEAEASARAVLVLEPPASGGRVKTGRKGTGMFTIEGARQGGARRPGAGKGRQRNSGNCAADRTFAPDEQSLQRHHCECWRSPGRNIFKCGSRRSDRRS